jgi:outer membrane protein assembly factor BamB
MLRWFLGPALAVACAGTLGADEAREAREIIAASGMRAGLCLHLGCGRAESAGLTAALAQNPNFMVHALALDGASLARARERIEAQNVLGRAVAEKVAVSLLPYLPDLANLVVVEDLAALTAQGVTREEILRVTAPGGAVLVKEGGHWAKTIKPRPKEMDDWGHPLHGADGNMVSQDKLLKFPLGLRWIDGLPGNFATYWGIGCCSVIAGGRCFTFNVNEIENLNPSSGSAARKDYYLGARDAFNGLPLWKINCGPTDPLRGNWHNAGPLVADAERAYAPQEDKVIIVEAASGKVLHTCATRYPAVRLTLVDGTLLASCWEGRDVAKRDPLGGTPNGYEGWAAYFPKTEAGSLEAFDARTGSAKWSASVPPFMFVASHGTVYVLTNRGNPPTERQVVALDLKTGREKWRVAHTAFGKDPYLQLNCCGPGFVVVGRKHISKNREDSGVFVLSADDGKVLRKVQPVRSIMTPIIDGQIWCGDKKRDPLTGEVKGDIPALAERFRQGTLLDPVDDDMGDNWCTRTVVVGPYFCRTRWFTYQEVLPEGSKPAVKLRMFRVARGNCVEGMVPANGMFYTSQSTFCGCCPAQPWGYLAIGSCGERPAAADFAKPRPVEKGPAFGAAQPRTAAAREWPTFRHDAERSASAECNVPQKLQEVWRVQVARLPGDGMVGEAWKAQLGSCATAPVVAGGLVFAACTHSGQVMAFDAATGKKAWTATLGGRIDTPPTIYKGLGLIGCHDGWVYALRASDGQLAWRTRAAPWERRMAVRGQLESVWPAIGSVLVHDDVAFACVGRTTEADGGIAVVALAPATGAHLWGKQLAAEQDGRPGPLSRGQRNDLLLLRDGFLGLHNIRLDPKTGDLVKVVKLPFGTNKTNSQDDILGGTVLSRSPTAFMRGKVYGHLMAWNDKLIVAPSCGITPEKAKLPDDLKELTARTVALKASSCPTFI